MTETVVDSVEGLQRLILAMMKPVEEPRIQPDSWQKIVLAMEEAEQGYFDNATGPDGQPWPKLSPVTIAKKGRDTILIDEGLLVESLTRSGGQNAIRDMTLDEVVFGTRRE